MECLSGPLFTFATMNTYSDCSNIPTFDKFIFKFLNKIEQLETSN